MPCQMEARCSAKNLLFLHIRKTDNSKANNTTMIYNSSYLNQFFFYLNSQWSKNSVIILSSFLNVHDTTFPYNLFQTRNWELVDCLHLLFLQGWPLLIKIAFSYYM